MIKSNDDAPHKAIIWITAEVHELLPTGECSGLPTYKVVQFPLSINGDNKAVAVRRLEDFLKKANELCLIET